MYKRIPIFAALLIMPSLSWAQPPLAELSDIASRLESAIRSQSEASNRPSMAMIDRETAVSMNYDNQLKHVRTYFEKRKLNREYREAERRPRRTYQQITESGKRNAPDRLTVRQYDPYSGEISWPAALREAKYENARQYMNRLFVAHATAGGGIDSEHYGKVYSSLDKFQDMLGRNYESTNPQQWVAAKKFLKSLQYEARFPVGS